MIKKIIPILVIIALVFTLSCKGNESSELNNKPLETSKEEVAEETGTEGMQAEAKAEETESAIDFYTSLDEAKKAAAEKKKFLFFKSEAKPIMVDLYTDWCSWCKKLDAETYSDPAVAEYVKKNIIPLKIHAEKEPYLTKKFKVTGFPTILFIDAEENEIDRLVGYFGPEDYLNKLKLFFEEGKSYGNLKKQYEASPTLEVAKNYLDSLNERGMYDEALEVAEYVLKEDPSNTNAKTVKFQVLFGKQGFDDEAKEKAFAELAKEIEKDVDGAYASFKSTFYLIMSSYYYAEKMYNETIDAVDILFTLDEVKENERVKARISMLKANSLIRIGALSDLKRFVKENGHAIIAVNFDKWVENLNSSRKLKLFGELEDAIGNVLTQVNQLFSQGKNIETGSKDLNIPKDPASGETLIYKCSLDENKRPVEFIIKTPSPEKYGAQDIFFNMKTGRLEIGL